MALHNLTGVSPQYMMEKGQSFFWLKNKISFGFVIVFHHKLNFIIKDKFQNQSINFKIRKLFIIVNLPHFLFYFVVI